MAQLQAELLATKLATYRYRDAGPQAPQQLGFIIDDQPDSPRSTRGATWWICTAT